VFSLIYKCMIWELSNEILYKDCFLPVFGSVNKHIITLFCIGAKYGLSFSWELNFKTYIIGRVLKTKLIKILYISH
jgi:hypothetical protein